jgi:hypothetical protein
MTEFQEGQEVSLKVRICRNDSEQALIEFNSMAGPYTIRVPLSELSRALSNPTHHSKSVVWGVRGGPGRQNDDIQTACTTPSGTYAAYSESLARYDTRDRPEDLYQREVESFVFTDEWRVAE